MNNQFIFDPSRYFRLLNHHLFSNLKTIGIILAFIIGFNIFIAWVVSLETGVESNFHYIWFGLTLLIPGFLYSSYAFSNLSTDAGKQFYLSLPASNLEKFLSKWTATAIILPIVLLFVFYLIANFNDAAFLDASEQKVHPFKVGDNTTWLLLKIYFAVQGFFLLGSISFVKLAIIKTPLATFIFFGSLVGLTYLLALAIFGVEMFNSNTIQPSENFKRFMEEDFVKIVEVLFWGVLPILLGVLTFLKVKEKEL